MNCELNIFFQSVCWIMEDLVMTELFQDLILSVIKDVMSYSALAGATVIMLVAAVVALRRGYVRGRMRRIA
jgi:hypothetical protein